MIITLKDATSHGVASRIVSLRENRGATTLGRVLTLIIVVPDLIGVDRAIEISDAASRGRPCRVIAVVDSPDAGGAARPNAQIRVGDTASPSDIIVLEPKGQAVPAPDTLVMPLPLSSTPVIIYWSVAAPHNPGEYPLGRIATRRITDSRGSECPSKILLGLSQYYTPGDMDLGWAGATLWRAFLATVAAGFDQVPVPMLVRGHETHPSFYLTTAWIHWMLGVPVTRQANPHASAIIRVCFYFTYDSQVSLQRWTSSNVTHPYRNDLATADVNLPKGSVQNRLMEGSYQLSPGVLYGGLLTRDLYLLPEAAERIARRVSYVNPVPLSPAPSILPISSPKLRLTRFAPNLRH